MSTHRHRAFALALCLSLGALAASCGGHTTTPGEIGIVELRRQAADSPRDAAAQREAGIGELLLRGGDAARARAQLDRAVALAPHDPSLLLISALEHDVHGRPTEALDTYLAALEAARAGTEPGTAAVAEVAAGAIEDLADVAPQFRTRVTERVPPLVASPGRLGPAAVQTLQEMLIDLAYRRGEVDAVRTIARATGCVPEWRVIGPFGPRELLGFDEPTPADAPGPLAEEYDLGPGRGVRATRTVQARGCSSHLGGGPVSGGGTTVVQAFVDVPTAGDYVLRLETPNSIDLMVDGRSVVRHDARVRVLPRVSFHSVHLAAGRRELRAKLTTRHPNPILVLGITTPDGRALAAASPPGAFTDEIPEGSDALSVYLRASTAMARGDFVTARETLARSTTPRDSSAVMLVLRGAAALSDPLRSDDVRRDDGRALLRRARVRDPNAWYPALQLPRLEAAESQAVAAIGALRTAAARWPNVVAFPLAIADLVQARGWDAETERQIARAREIAPEACIPIKVAFDAARRRGHNTEARELADLLERCDARSDARFSLFVRAREWAEARTELARLDRFEVPTARFGILSAQLGIARSSGDDAAIESTLLEMVEQMPRMDSLTLQVVDRRLAQHRDEAAREVLTSGLRREPAALGDLRRVLPVIGGVDDLAAFRVDGAQVIRDFEASGRTYDQPKALILDYTVARIYEDGSTLELTHNIIRVQSEEAVDDEGEFRLPEGARLLKLHTVKADGRRLEPDSIEGKETISLPNLAVGDYVEFEFVRTGSPPNGFPGGYLGDRFYFRSFEEPFDRSELTLVMPTSMHPVVDPRGPAPRTEERTEGDLRILHFLVRESRPLVVEPLAVAIREFIPSVNIGVGATWERFIDGLRDVLADRDVRDPASLRVLNEILGNSRSADAMTKAKRIHAWVLRNVEDSDEFFGLAPAMLASRNGHRARILRYLLRLAGVPADIALVRAKSADSTVSELADGDTYEGVLVGIQGQGAHGRIWLATGDRGAPFGYVPPQLRGQDGIMLAAGAPRVRIPEGEEGSDRRTLDVDVQLRNDGAATVAVTETYRGMGAVYWRQQLESIPNDQLEQRFEEAYVARLVPGATLSTLRMTGREDPEAPLVFEYAFEVSSLGRRAGNHWALPALFPTQLAGGFARLPSRTTTELVPSPVDVDVVVHLTVPSGVATPTAPRAVDTRGPNGMRFSLTSSRDGSTLVLTRHVRIPISRIAPADYPAFAQFCRSADEAEGRELPVALR